MKGSFSSIVEEFPTISADLVNQCLWRHRDKRDDERILLTPKASEPSLRRTLSRAPSQGFSLKLIL